MKLNRSVRLRRAGSAVREGEWCVFYVGIAGFEIVTMVVVVTVTGRRVGDVSLVTVAGTVVATVARSCRGNVSVVVSVVVLVTVLVIIDIEAGVGEEERLGAAVAGTSSSLPGALGVGRSLPRLDDTGMSFPRTAGLPLLGAGSSFFLSLSALVFALFGREDGWGGAQD